MKAKMENLSVPAFDNDHQMMACVTVTNDSQTAFGTFMVRLDRDDSLHQKHVEQLAVRAVSEFINSGEQLVITE